MTQSTTTAGSRFRVPRTRGALSGLLLVEMLVFVGILALGLLYAWRKKVLQWV